MAANLAMQAEKILFFTLFQVMINSTVLKALEEPSMTPNSRSAFFVSRKNTRLVGHVIKWLKASSLTSCSQLCVSKSWCTSTNFITYFNKDGKGTCELNKHDSKPLIDEFEKLQNQQGVTFSLLLKGCLMTGCMDGGSCLFDEKNNTFSCFKKPQSGDNSQVDTACIQSKPLGMEDGSITDNMITVSSTHPDDKAAWGRLHCSLGSWATNTDDDKQWFQVNFVPKVKLITDIATQGNGKMWWWVKTYYVMYKAGEVTLQEYKENDQKVIFQGNTNKDDVVKNKINNPFQADTVRIIPTAFSGRIALRIELYGCDI
ncbi:retinoschisin-like isoform X2 [Oculina patagonica]